MTSRRPSARPTSRPRQQPGSGAVPESERAVIVLSRALDQCGDVLAQVHAEQLHLPTPCRDWDVARLVAHVVAAPGRFLSAMTGAEPDWSTEPPPIGTEWATVFRNAADDLIHAWHQRGDDAETRTVDWQTAEIAVHTWDLAQATGQTEQLATLDRQVAERSLAFLAAGLTEEKRGDAFDRAVAVEDDAPVYHRLAAYAGRQLDEAWADGTA